LRLGLRLCKRFWLAGRLDAGKRLKTIAHDLYASTKNPKLGMKLKSRRTCFSPLLLSKNCKDIALAS